RGGEGVARSAETFAGRAVRFIDSYVETGAHPTHVVRRQDGMTNVPASLFLRPHSAGFAVAERFKLRRILAAMRRAAPDGRLFHLWFHPHNFGVDQDENFAMMEAIAVEAARLRQSHGWSTLNMAEAAALAEARTTRDAVAAYSMSREEGFARHAVGF